MTFRLSLAVAGTLLAALPAGVPAAASPCTVAWSDPAGDTVYTSGTGLASPKVPDDDLDAREVTFRATMTELIATVRVARLNATGPTLGTGHGVSLVVTKYGKTMAFAATRDATFGDRTSAPDADSRVTLDVDAAAGTFTLRVRRSDVTRVAGTPIPGGDLFGIYVTTLRHDAVQAAVNATPVGAGRPGLPADETATGERGAALSLDLCDAALRRSTLQASVVGTTAVATLTDSTGGALAGQPLRLVRLGRTVATARTASDGTARFALPRSGTYTVVYAGVVNEHTAARATVRR